MKMVKNKTSPELGERMEQRYERPLWVTHPAAIPASFPLQNGSAKKSPGIPPLRKPQLAAAPAQSSPWSPVLEWSIALSQPWPQLPPQCPCSPGQAPPHWEEKGFWGPPTFTPPLTAWTPWSRAGSSPDAESTYVLMRTTKTSANN